MEKVQIRVTPEQRQVLREAADAAGQPLSAWLLQLGLRAAERARKRQ